jgi:hypothetical protein
MVDARLAKEDRSEVTGTEFDYEVPAWMANHDPLQPHRKNLSNKRTRDGYFKYGDEEEEDDLEKRLQALRY